MPDAITATFGADARPFKREIASMEALSVRAGKNIAAGLSGTTAGYSTGEGSASGHGGRGGIIGEMVGMFRELGRGNFSRMPGSLSILIQRMGLLKYLMVDNAGAAAALADATEKAALRAANLAKWATEEAVATRAAYDAKGTDVVVTMAQVDADEAAAVAARVHAEAMREEASAANAAAAGVKNTIGPLGIVLGIILGIAVGAYAAYKQSTALINKLTGFKIPDFEPKYIAQHLQAVNRIAEDWKHITLEVQKTIDKYESVSEVANRAAEASKKHYDHLRKMNELSMATPEQKEKNRAAIDAAERDANLAAKSKEQADLAKEGANLQAQANAVTVPSKEHDQNISDRNMAMFKAADEAAKAIEASKMEGTFRKNGRDIFRAYNAATDSGVSTKDLNKAEAQVIQDRAKWKKAYEASINQMATNDETRKAQEELTKRASESLSKAAQTGLEVEDMRRTNSQANKDESEEVKAKLLEGKKGEGSREVTEREKIGAAESLVQVSLLDVNKQQLAVQQETLNLIRSRQGYDNGVGGTHFD
jgi:hypothetical protein